jgi:hypothetical protein
MIWIINIWELRDERKDPSKKAGLADKKSILKNARKKKTIIRSKASFRGCIENKNAKRNVGRTDFRKGNFVRMPQTPQRKNP